MRNPFFFSAAFTVLLSQSLMSLPVQAEEAPKNTEPKEEQGPKFTIDTSKSSKSLKVGKSGTLSLHIQPVKGMKVHPDAPLSVKVKPSTGLTLESKKLGRKNVKEKKAKDPVLETTISAKSKGSQEVIADLTFFLCSDTVCDRVKKQVKVQVEVTE